VVRIIANQSDGASATKSIPIDLHNPLPAPLPSGNAGQPGNPPPWEFAALAIAVSAGTGGLFVGLRYRKTTPREKVLARTIEQYQSAKTTGDYTAAKEYALANAKILRECAELHPEKRHIFLEKAELWETIAGGFAPEERSRADRSSSGESGGTFPDEAEISDLIRGTDIGPDVLTSCLRIAQEIGREGREGSPVGTAFLVGDLASVMAGSSQLVLNPFKGHEKESRLITDPGLAENIKEFALLDGAFVISGDGVVEAAGRYITVDTSGVLIPAGLGTRHASVAGITKVTRSIGIVVSQSGGQIKIFKDGQIVRTIAP
jgi:hypothetical protein